MFQTTNQFFWWTILAISETLLLHEFGTSTNLGRYHRLPHGCTMYGILFRKYYWKVTNCKHMGTVYDRSFKRGLAICYGPITCPMCCTISENPCPYLTMPGRVPPIDGNFVGNIVSTNFPQKIKKIKKRLCSIYVGSLCRGNVGL